MAAMHNSIRSIRTLARKAFTGHHHRHHVITGLPMATRTLHYHPRYFSTISSSKVTNNDNDTYAVAIITDEGDINLDNLQLQEILEEAPGTYPRDFFSLSLTSIGDAAFRKQRSLSSHYSANVKIHPWFILPRESEVAVSFGCLRAIITREKALLFDAHKPTIRQHASRIRKRLHRKDGFTLTDGQILFSSQSKKNQNSFEIIMLEEIIREVCTMYLRRVRLYEPIVNSLMDRAASEAFSPSGLHKLAPVKDSLQRFGK